MTIKGTYSDSHRAAIENITITRVIGKDYDNVIIENKLRGIKIIVPTEAVKEAMKGGETK